MPTLLFLYTRLLSQLTNLLDMCLLVFRAVRRVWEWLVAAVELAAIGTLPRVGPHVYLQVLQSGECLWAARILCVCVCVCVCWKHCFVKRVRHFYNWVGRKGSCVITAKQVYVKSMTPRTRHRDDCEKWNQTFSRECSTTSRRLYHPT